MALRHAIEEAAISPDQMGYMNAHGTSTKINDRTETMVIKKVFGDHAKKAGRFEHQIDDRPHPGRGWRC